MRKKFKDGAYYWVRRRSHIAGDQVLHAPNWEPMLWDAASGKFMTRGDPHGRAPEELANIGEIIARRPKRTTRKGWIPTEINRKARRAEPVYDNICNSAKVAAAAGTGLPLQVEVSWDNADFNLANGFARSCSNPNIK
jgi:hypothetical protein